jgi:hypothetical protein
VKREREENNTSANSFLLGFVFLFSFSFFSFLWKAYLVQRKLLLHVVLKVAVPLPAVLDRHTELGGEIFEIVEELVDTQTRPGGLGAVGRSDALASRSNAVFIFFISCCKKKEERERE